MLRGRSAPQADRHAGDQRHAALAAEHEAVFRRLVDELVHRAQREIDHAHLDDRPQSRERHADRRAHDGGLGNRRVDDAARPELLRQPAVLAEDAAAAEVLAERDHVRIGAHRFLQGKAGGLSVGHCGHGIALISTAPRRCR